jgi:hypothetical protein
VQQFITLPSSNSPPWEPEMNSGILWRVFTTPSTLLYP